MMRTFSQLRRQNNNVIQRLQHCKRLKTTASLNTISVTNPYNGETYCEVDKIENEDIDSILSTSVEMQKEYWSMTGATIGLIERQVICSNFLDEFDKYSDEIAKDISCMMGKPINQSYKEISTMRDRAEKIIEMSTQFLSDMPVPPQVGFDRKIRKEPKGTILIISPWNYPLLCTINSLLPALLSGNSILLKLSSKTPLVANHFVNALQDAGCPQGLVTPINCDHDTTAKLINDSRVSSVVFTGSVSGGYEIQKQTSNRLIDCTLELGGKDPAYIRPDADLQYAVESVVDGAMYNTGQSCCAIERVYVHSKIYNDVIDMAKQIVDNNYFMGDPLYEHPKDIDNRKGIDMDKSYDLNLPPTTNIGPMAQGKNAIDFLSMQVNDAINKGAMLISGSDDNKLPFFKPTILKDCTHDMNIMKEESFGPILPFQCVSDDKEAIQLMNDSKYGLTASVFTKDKMSMERIFAPQIQTGTLFMNRCDYLDPFLPWVGVKDTGKGVSLSPFCFNNFTKLKSLHFKLKTN